jgi:hypothetical protein
MFATTRLNDDQRYLLRCMRNVFDLYNDIFLKKSLQSPDLYLKKIFDTIFEKKYVFKKKAKRFESRGIGRISYENAQPFDPDMYNNSITVDESDLRSFSNLMDILYLEIKNYNYIHFLLNNEVKIIEHGVGKYVSGSGYVGGINQNDDISKIRFEQAEATWDLIRPYKGNNENEIKVEGKRSLIFSNDVVAVLSSHFRTFKTQPLSDFGRAILSLKNVRPTDEIYSLKSIKMVTKLSLLDIIKSLFVNFHIDFDNFKRFKICQFSKCGKFILETKLNSLDYCNSVCRKNAFDERMPENIRKCRNRQISWINYKADNLKITTEGIAASCVSISDCRRCEEPRDSGHCPILKKNNKQIFKFLQIPTAKII